jgi:NADH:ubiquinone oxidoreductase subunit F (NADH-binding)
MTLPRLLAGVASDGTAVGLDRHLQLHGELRLPRRGGDLIRLVEAAGLHGRGGAAFPTARKLAAVAPHARQVIVNATEGEPVSGKDKLLLRCAPHLVLDGAVAAAAAVGARRAVVAVAAGARRERAALAAALTERPAGRVALRVAVVPDGFVAGEETALVRAVEGGPALPQFGPRPYERGILVQNAETVAHLALIARHGPEWFRQVGTAEEPGSTLVTVSGAIRHPGVSEVALGAPVRALLDACGGTTARAQALLVGGYFGAWVPADEALARTLADADFGSLGARAFVVLPQGGCGVVETARIARLLAGESAGQCGPCVFGLDAIAGALERMAAGAGDERPRLGRWLGQVDGRGACRHPDGAARLVRSALEVFRHEFELHARGRCSADRVAA